MLYCARKKKYIFRKRRRKDMAQYEQWAGFKGRNWTHSVDVRSFIQDNYTPYEGDDSFLEGPTEAFRSFRKKSVQKVAFLIWKQM